jgi:hypothetical protein
MVTKSGEGVLSFPPLTLTISAAKSYLKEKKLNRIRIYLPIIFLTMIFGYETVVIGQGPAEEMCIPMGIILIQPPETVAAKRKSVEFPHTSHFKFPCRKCHHTWKGDSIVNCTTSGCHDVTVSPIKSKMKGSNKVKAMRRYYKKAYHSLCIGCHRDIKLKNKALEESKRKLTYKLRFPGRKPTYKLRHHGPTSCSKCHPKEKLFVVGKIKSEG